jgi:hypothetical protein
MSVFNAIMLSILYYGKKSNVIMIAGAILLTLSMAGVIYAGSLAIKDASEGNLVGPNSLPKTTIGPLSAYHVEYGSVFILIIGFALLTWGYIGVRERKLAQRKLR